MKKDKIFDEEIKTYLIELGMEEKQIRTIRKKKLKEYAISILSKIIEAIKLNDFNSIQEYLMYSPGGDCMGNDNTFINFGGIAGWDDYDIEDLFKYLSDHSVENSIKFG